MLRALVPVELGEPLVSLPARPTLSRWSSELVSSSIGPSRRSITWAGFPSRRSASSRIAARSPSSAFSASFSAIRRSRSGSPRRAIRSASLKGFSLFELPIGRPMMLPYPLHYRYEFTLIQRRNYGPSRNDTISRLTIERRRITPVVLAPILSLIIVKLKDHNIRAPILGMGRVVTISRAIRILVITTTNLHDFERTGRLAPLLDLINCVKNRSMKDAVTIGSPCLASARSVAVELKASSQNSLGTTPAQP